MTRPRSQLVSLDATPYYHCISRCVRRAFLCGKDRFSRKSFDHRKPWLVERMRFLANLFAIDIAAYAVMSNHYHLVLHIDDARAQSWSDEEVVKRWITIYKGPHLIRRFKAGERLGDAEKVMLAQHIKALRRKLSSLSRFMACLNEYMARKANLEDGCTGRFWEGRFKSQALLDEAALVSCMAYVDLNPVRAGIASTLESSDFTSVQDRVIAVQRKRMKQENPAGKSMNHLRPRLMAFGEHLRESDRFCKIPFNLKDYLGLVDWTGRSVRPDKKGSIALSSPKILNQLGLTSTQWRILALEIQKESILILNGLETLAAMERRAERLKAA